MSPASTNVEYLTEQVALDYLEGLAAGIPEDQAIVELGTHQGGSILYLARGAKAPVYGIDPWGLSGAYTSVRMSRYYNSHNMEVARALLAEHGLEANLIRGFSVPEGKAWKGPKVGLLYVDAVHNDQSVTADVNAWLPHCVGHVCFDDYNQRYPGVMAAVDRLCRGPLEWIGQVGTRLAVTMVRGVGSGPGE